MRNLRNYWSSLLFVIVAIFIVSCSDTDEIEANPDAVFDVTLNVSESDVAPQNEEVIVDPVTKGSILARVVFTSTDESMKRLYITQNISGAGETVFKPVESTVNLKGDGAIDISTSNAKSFDFQFTLPIKTGLGANGNIVYKFWATSGNGDPRDPEKRKVAGPGTITIKYGTGVNAEAEVKVYANKKLSAPSADGTSESFISLLNGKVYTIKPSGIASPTQEQFDEYISFWDFGYINKTEGGPTLHSASTYPVIAFGEFPQFAASTLDKNKCYFKASTKTTTEFDAIATSGQLDFITKPSEESVSNLGTGDGKTTVIEFVDQYDKKGMIKVLEAIPGNSPGINFIRIDIKVQP